MAAKQIYFWKDTDIDFLIKYINKMTYLELSVRIGVSEAAVKRKAKELGILKNIQWKSLDELTEEDYENVGGLCERFKCSEQEVLYGKRKKGYYTYRKITLDEDELMVKLFAQGFKIAQIARRFGVTDYCVRYRLKIQDIII